MVFLFDVKMKLLIGICILAVAFARQGPLQKCPEHQTFSECGTMCPLTCDNYENPPKICGYACSVGCECDKGYVKTKDHRCVRKEECAAKTVPERGNFPQEKNARNKCPEHQTFSECGTMCPLTCDNYENPPKICGYACSFGCQCDKGYVKTKDQRCVRKEECSAKTIPERGTGAKPSVSNVCRLPTKFGNCSFYSLRFHFDVRSARCKTFLYSGCNGNKNNFRSLQECERACR